MKLLMTTDTVGGVWTYAIELAQALEPHDVEVLLATMGAPVNVDQRRQADALAKVRLFESDYKLEWMQDPWQDVRRAGEWLLDLEQAHQPDVVHLNGFCHGALPWSAPVLVVGHSCVCSWWQAVKNEPAPSEWNEYRNAVGAGLRAADMVAAPSAAMLAALRRLYGPLPPSRVIYNGRDAARYRPAAKEPFVLTAGRLWDEAKNLSALQQVAPRLPWPVYVAGDHAGPDGAAIPTAAVQPLGRLDATQLAGWMSRAAIYALPARYEPFGLSALEAALSGCALALGDIDSLREIWADAALFVPPDDAEALERALLRLIDSKSLCERMAEKALTHAARYTAARMAQAYVQTYRDLLDVKGAGLRTPDNTGSRAHVILRYPEGSLATDEGSFGVPQDDILQRTSFVRRS